MTRRRTLRRAIHIVAVLILLAACILGALLYRSTELYRRTESDESTAALIFPKTGLLEGMTTLIYGTPELDETAVALFYQSLDLDESAAALKDYASRVREVCPLMDHPNEYWSLWVGVSVVPDPASVVSVPEVLLQLVREGPVGASESPHVHIDHYKGEPPILTDDYVNAQRWSESQGNFEARFDCWAWGESAHLLKNFRTEQLNYFRSEYWDSIRSLVFLSGLAIGVLYGMYGAIRFWSNRRSRDAR